MAEISGFFPDVNGDREYTTDFLALWAAAIIGNGVYNGDLAVTAGSNMQIVVPSGRAWINGYHYRNDGNLALAIDNADGVLNRKDIVVLRWDINARSITAQVVKGTPASTATAPAIMRTVEQYDLKLAEISIPAGTTAITQALITDTRADELVCGIVVGTVKELSTKTLYQQFTAQFQDWFSNIKEQLSGSVEGNLQNQIDTKATQIYTHTKNGTVHALVGSGSNGKFQATADYALDDTFTINGVTVPAALQNGDYLPDGFFKAGNWVTFNFDGTRINFKSAGGGAAALNLFVQPDVPTVKEGLWIQAPERHPVHRVVNKSHYAIGGEWSQESGYPDMPASPKQLRTVIGRVVTSSKVYLWTYVNTNNQYDVDVYLYALDIATKVWTVKGPLKSLGSYLHPIVSGIDKQGRLVLKATEYSCAYDPQTDTLTELIKISLPTNYGRIEGTSICGQDADNIYFYAFSYTSPTYFTTFYAYNFATDTFNQLFALDQFDFGLSVDSSVKYTISVIFYDGLFYVFYGQYTPTHYYCDKLMSIDPQTKVKTQMPFSGAVPGNAYGVADFKYYPRVAVYQNTIYATYPINYTGAEHQIIVYDISNCTQSTLTYPYTQNVSLNYLNVYGKALHISGYDIATYAFESESLPANTLALLDGKGYSCKLTSTSTINFLRTVFNDVWWYDTDFREYPTYVGDGAQWNKIKN